MATLYVALRVTLDAANSADDLFYPAWRRHPVKQPLFVLAAARSGTTFLHRLLALDTERFFTPRLYETVLPAVSLLRALQVLGRADDRLGAPAARLLARLERGLFRGWNDIHPMGLAMPEEDEAIFVHTLFSPALYLLLPNFKGLAHVSSPANLEPDARREMMGFYRDCLTRMLYAGDGEHTLLVKNVLSAGRTTALLETFPDMRVVSPIRHPFEAIPSLVSMFHRVWAALLPDETVVDHHAFARIAMDYYLECFEFGAKLPTEDYVRVRYEDLTMDPKGSVEKVYAHLGLEPSPAFLERLTREAATAARFRSVHHYELSDFDLDPAEIRRVLAPVFDQCRFDA